MFYNYTTKTSTGVLLRVPLKILGETLMMLGCQQNICVGTQLFVKWQVERLIVLRNIFAGTQLFVKWQVERLIVLRNCFLALMNFGDRCNKGIRNSLEKLAKTSGIWEAFWTKCLIPTFEWASFRWLLFGGCGFPFFIYIEFKDRSERIIWGLATSVVLVWFLRIGIYML